MLKIIRNPLIEWLFLSFKSILLELKCANKKLKILGPSRLIECNFGHRNTIYKNAVLTKVNLDDFSYIGENTIIRNANIGKFCSIGPDCKIGLGKHPSTLFVSTHPIFFSTLKQAQITFADKNYFDEYEEINIGNDVWIGSNVIILDGVIVSDGSIIAAGSVVTKNVPPYAIVGGVPAKLIKHRFNENEINKLLTIKWWDMDIDFLRKNCNSFHDVTDFLNNLNSKHGISD